MVWLLDLRASGLFPVASGDARTRQRDATKRVIFFSLFCFPTFVIVFFFKNFPQTRGTIS